MNDEMKLACMEHDNVVLHSDRPWPDLGCSGCRWRRNNACQNNNLNAMLEDGLGGKSGVVLCCAPDFYCKFWEAKA